MLKGMHSDICRIVVLAWDIMIDMIIDLRNVTYMQHKDIKLNL